VQGGGEKSMVQNLEVKEKEEMPETEVVAKAKRKRFTAAEKLRLLREVEACQGSGEIGALLRREGIYSSYLTTWRRQRETGELEGLSPQKRGPNPNPEAIELAKLRRGYERLKERMRQAELILGHYQTAGTDQMDVLLSLQHPGCLQPVFCRLDDRPMRIGPTG
jgi:transposase-like protein